MKISYALILTGTAILPQFGLAGPPFSESNFGKLEAILDFCDRLSSQTVSGQMEHKKFFAEAAIGQMLDVIRATREYKEAYREATMELDQMPRRKSASNCAVFLKGSS